MSNERVKWLAMIQRQFCQKIETQPKQNEERMCTLQVRQKKGMDYRWDMLIDSRASFTSTVNPKLLDNPVCDPKGLNMSTNVGQKSTNHRGEMV